MKMFPEVEVFKQPAAALIAECTDKFFIRKPPFPIIQELLVCIYEV